MKYRSLAAASKDLWGASLYTQSINCDWRSLDVEQDFEIVMPEISEQTRKDYDLPKEDPEQADRYWEWKDSLYPMMNYYWPVEIHMDRTPEEAATLMDRFAGATSLVSFNPDSTKDFPHGYGITLTGGGMNLAWDIAAAYIACGCLPPIKIIDGLPGFNRFSNAQHRFILKCARESVRIAKVHLGSTLRHIQKIGTSYRSGKKPE